MEAAGFRCLLPPAVRSPIITAFHEPDVPGFTFERFYAALKARRYVIYPGKVSRAATFRIGTIGHVFPADIDDLTRNVAEVMREIREG
jgi:2-aminoethylphosphonate-pyruvate transaminase